MEKEFFFWLTPKYRKRDNFLHFPRIGVVRYFNEKQKKYLSVNRRFPIKRLILPRQPMLYLRNAFIVQHRYEKCKNRLEKDKLHKLIIQAIFIQFNIFPKYGQQIKTTN